ncbi:hypothetical protein E4T42_05577 [Aureobasidium subglaciale]|nr:hypothetical protein E4T42_05577 [Aureobasidium subglaciale]
MDRVPLELKQRICSFLRASPKLLKPVRLVSKDFASAAAPYLLPRIFLFKHPDSCDEIEEIIKHPKINKHITTILVDLSVLKPQWTLQAWIDGHQHLQHGYPDWLDFKPDDVNRRLRNSQEHYWKAQQRLVTVQSSLDFQTRFLELISQAFEICPNLTNIVFAPPQPQELILRKKLDIFQEIHPHGGSWVGIRSHDPSGFGMVELLEVASHQKAGLNSLTIIDLPFGCDDYNETGYLDSLARLKHIRIGWNRLGSNPGTKFGFDLEDALSEAHSLETFWIGFAPLARTQEYVGSDMLDAMVMKGLRDVMLSNISVSEDSIVAFLLRHGHSLRHLSLGITISDGSWVSVFRRTSLQMKVLTQIQLVGMIEKIEGVPMTFSPRWCSEAIDCMLHGTELSEPEYYTLDKGFEEYDLFAYGCEGPRRSDGPPENGLWEDFDGNVNFCF